MKHRLLAREGEHWEVWTTWYDARLDPSQHIPCYSPPDLKLEEARVLLPDELWKQGPAAVNARIRERIEESGCERPPEQIDGVRLRIDDDGKLDEQRQGPEEGEADNPLQQQMFSRIRQKMAQLMGHMERIGNQYPELASVLRDYDAEISSAASLRDLDIPMLWMTGQGVIAQSEAFRDMDENALTPRLEPQVQGLLAEIAGLHGAFITGFKKGRELIARRLQAVAGPQAVERLRKAQESFLEMALALPDSAMTSRVRQIYSAARDILLAAEIRVDEKVRTVISVAYNTIGVVGGILNKVPESNGAAMIGVAMGPAGLNAWATFFQAAAGPIAAIAQITPEMRAFVQHLFARHGWELPADGENTDD